MENKNVCWFDMEIVDFNLHLVDWFEKINVWECVVHWFWEGIIIKEAAWVENEDICWFETGNRKSDLNQNWYKCEDKRQTMCFAREILFAAQEERK